MNTLLILPYETENIFPSILEGKMSQGWAREENDWKQITTTLKKHQLKVNWFQTFFFFFLKLYVLNSKECLKFGGMSQCTWAKKLYVLWFCVQNKKKT